MNLRAYVTIISFFASASLLMAGGGWKAMTMPDFTKGVTIPEKAKQDRTLGVTGMRGWMFVDNLETFNEKPKLKRLR